MRVQILQSPRTRNQDTLIADGLEGVSCETVEVGGEWEHVLYIHVGGVGSRNGHQFKVKLPMGAMAELREAIAAEYAGVVNIADYRETHLMSESAGSKWRYTRCGLVVDKATRIVLGAPTCQRCAVP